MKKGKKKSLFVSVSDLINLHNPRIISIVDRYGSKKSHCAHAAADGASHRACILNALMKSGVKYGNRARPITIFKNNEVLSHLGLPPAPTPTDIMKSCISVMN